jgi:prepilin-type N-terminal cleavage/methylation domain-containing protein
MRANHHRRGFNLIELLIALAITASLMAATMVAIDASFRAYQTTTEVASTQATTRLVVNRILTLIRTGQEFAPYPDNPQLDTVVESNWMEFLTVEGDILRLEWIPATRIMWLRRDAGGDNVPGVWDGEWPLLEGMIEQDEAPNDPPNQAPDVNDYHEPFTPGHAGYRRRP